VKVREDRSVRNRACYLAIGVTLEGAGRFWGSGGAKRRARSSGSPSSTICTSAGTKDVLICCVDGLEGFPEAIEAVFPEAGVQTCVVHQIRAGMRYVSYKERNAVAAAFRPVCRAYAVGAGRDASSAVRLNISIAWSGLNVTVLANAVT